MSGPSIRVSSIPRLFGAQAMTPTRRTILVLPERIGDRALIAHEQVHCHQMRQRGRFGSLTFWLRYLTSKKYRLAVEVEAYRVQARLDPANIDGMARTLAKLYWLGITPERARELIEHQPVESA